MVTLLSLRCAHRSIGKSSENLLGCASEVFFGFSILLLAVNIGIYQSELGCQQKWRPELLNCEIRCQQERRAGRGAGT